MDLRKPGEGEEKGEGEGEKKGEGEGEEEEEEEGEGKGEEEGDKDGEKNIYEGGERWIEGCRNANLSAEAVELILTRFIHDLILDLLKYLEWIYLY